MDKLRILHNVPIIGKLSFGLGQIPISLAQAQYALNQHVNLWCLDNDENIKWASENYEFSSRFITGFKLTGPKIFLHSPAIKKKARESEKGAFDIIHQHGIWTGASSATLVFSKEKNIPTVVAPHGSLNAWALGLSGWKKKIALAAYEQSNLTLASCLHATSQNEISDFRDFGLKNPIAYVENGMQEKYLSAKGNPDRFRQEYEIPYDKRILLFLSRISPKKGLVMLVNAIDSIRKDFTGWQLIIAGVDEFNHKKEVESLIKLLNLEDRIKIIGPLFGDSKNDAFAASELFILPSYSEGSPMVVFESLAAGVPAITTKASSWNDLIEHNCGWWIDINTASISKSLKEAIVLTKENLQQMGQNGKKLISTKYTWEESAKKTIKLYNWLLKRDLKPDFVTLN